MPANKLLIKYPVISEKAVARTESGKYTFLVDNGSNKSELKKAVEETYKVTVTGVNIVRIKSGKRNIKKAVVSLKAGDKINIES
ncbi:MAG: 50S ribosomal protein L23 [Patescibacteria group bacterium]|nr:50S ribosomal protein L23 [Patescibacteria group bacterium]MDE2144678.1 50S ribosomal protein L23 [Patescibacteria group bacterium]